jgi:surface protein
MFLDAVAFNQDISGWNTGAVEVLTSTFFGATAFNQDVGGWNTGAVTLMNNTFRDAVAFDQDLGGWNVTSMTDATTMFSGATLSTANYDALLIGWEGQLVNNTVTFHGGSSTYSAGAAATARANLIADHTWAITDGGPV